MNYTEPCGIFEYTNLRNCRRRLKNNDSIL